MAYQSLYRRFRPGRFDQMIGQDHVVRALRNAARDDKVAHAYLLSGPRGTGKTTAARILAKVLNCENPIDGEPCDQCESCESIDKGRSFDLHELDAASHNKVDDIRDLLSKVALGTPGRTKVYLLDEVHMLTSGAENALLKTLEEPPDHVVFVLATTEPHKVVETVRSRTQHLELALVDAETLAAHLRWVASEAELDVDDEVIEYVVEAARGSVRDALSAMDRVVAAGGIGVDAGADEDLVEALVSGDSGAAMAALDASIGRGLDVRVIGEGLISTLRTIFLLAIGAPTPRIDPGLVERCGDWSGRYRPARITAALELVGVALIDMRQSPDPRIDLEVALVRATRPPEGSGAVEMLDRIELLEEQVAALASGDGVSTSTPPPTEKPTADASKSPVDKPPSDAPKPPSAKPSSDSPAPAPPPAPGGPAAARARLQQAKSKVSDDDEVGVPADPGAADGAGEVPSAPLEEAPSVGATEPVESISEPLAPVADEPITEQADSTDASITMTVDQLNQTWTDSVMSTLSNKARARYQAGRFIAADGTKLTFALPNEIHRRRCEEIADEVIGALTTVVGAPCTLTLTVDEDAPRSPDSQRSASTAVQPQAEEEIDLSGLVDAKTDDGSFLDQVTKVFPGAEVVQDE